MVACGYNHVLTRLACYTEKNRPSLDGIVDYVETLQCNVYRENNLLIMCGNVALQRLLENNLLIMCGDVALQRLLENNLLIMSRRCIATSTGKIIC